MSLLLSNFSILTGTFFSIKSLCPRVFKFAHLCSPRKSGTLIHPDICIVAVHLFSLQFVIVNHQIFRKNMTFKYRLFFTVITFGMRWKKVYSECSGPEVKKIVHA